MLVMPIRMSSNIADGNQQKHLLPSFAGYKSVNLFFEELINIKVILFLIHELFREQNSLKEVIFFNLHDSSLGRHVNAASRKSSEIQAYSITKARTLLKRKCV